MYKKLKKQNGENFAQTLRNFHSGLLDIPDLDLIVRHAGRQAEPLIPYLMGLMSYNDDIPAATPENPFTLLDRAGYNAFHADTLQKQNSIKRYFAPGELLCTFNDHARYRDYHIVHAIRKDVDDIKRAAFTGREERQDEYGTSVISIQIYKEGGFISIKNRYNHTVDGSDNTFNSNPDNIIHGLSAALKDHFNVDFSALASVLPEGFVLMGNRIIKYHTEENNVYYGDQAWALNGSRIHAVNRAAGDALFDRLLFDNKTKTLKTIDPLSDDSFAKNFNNCYGGNRALCVQNGNLTLNGDILIGAEGSQIKTLSLPALTTMGNDCLRDAPALTQFHAPALTTMGNLCLCKVPALMQFHAPALTTMGDQCLYFADTLTQFHAPALTAMGTDCLHDTDALTQFHAPALTTMGNDCLNNANTLTQFHAPALTSMGYQCFYFAPALTQFHTPALTSMGNHCLYKSSPEIRRGARLTRNPQP